MPLTDSAIRHSKGGDKPIKLYDERGLFLLVVPTGGKWWRFKYQFNGREKQLSLGVYPDVGLKEARERRDELRKQVAAGLDPSDVRKATKSAVSGLAANSFEVVAREWYANQSGAWATTHGERILRRLERDIFPLLGSKPVTAIKCPELLTVLRRIEARGAVETAHRALQNCGQVFRYAIATGQADIDPTGGLRGALKPHRPRHYAAILEPLKLGELLRAIDTYQVGSVVGSGLRLLPLVFVRPGELRYAEWAEFNLDLAEWNIPAAKMKTKDQGDHLVPLSHQALAILRELHPSREKAATSFPVTGGVRARCPRTPSMPRCVT